MKDTCPRCGLIRLEGGKFTQDQSSLSVGTGTFQQEPVFVLRAQDASAPAVIQVWISMNRDAPKEKIESAQRMILEMRSWPTKKKAD